MGAPSPGNQHLTYDRQWFIRSRQVIHAHYGPLVYMFIKKKTTKTTFIYLKRLFYSGTLKPV